MRIFVLFFFILLMVSPSCSNRNSDKSKAGTEEIVRESMFCNVREYLKDNIRFRSRPIRKGSNYNSLLIGSPSNPYKGTPPLLIKLPDGSVINTAKIDIEDLKKKAPGISRAGVFLDIGSPSMDLYGVWPDGASRLMISAWVFIVNDESILSFNTYYRDDGGWDWPGYIPAIGNPQIGELYNFPLSQNEVLQVFGKPDKIREYLEE